VTHASGNEDTVDRRFVCGGRVLECARRIFHVDTVPAHATLYVAGPGAATIYLNGDEIGRYRVERGSELCDDIAALIDGRSAGIRNS
jgi:hypothetical protein